MPHLTWYDPSHGAERLELGGEVMVGRHHSCQVRLTSSKVSRRHARIFPRDDDWWVEDLGSTRGTMVNGEDVVRRALVQGDRVEVGDVVVRFFDDRPAGVPSVDAPSRMLTERTLAEVELLQTIGPGFKGADGGDHLVQLVRFGDQLRRCTNPAEIAAVMLERAVELTRAARGLVARTRRGSEEVLAFTGEGEVRPSRTFVDRVLQGQVGLLAVDTAADEQLAGAESVRHQHIRSIVCVPMWDGEHMVGYAYLDARVTAFRARDLDLLMVMAHHAATELARHELVERVRREEERQRRLLRFLPEAVVALLGEDDQEEALASLGERQVALIHLESTGLAELTARMSALEVQRFMDKHLEMLVHIAVDEHGGTLHRVTVSGLRLAFGAPVARGMDQDAHHALSAALAMRDAVEALRQDDSAYASVRLRIGVHAGRVVAGMMGPERRQEYSVVGAAVDEAGRVALSCPPGRVLATSECLGFAPPGVFSTVPAPDRRLQLAGGAAQCWWVVKEG